MMWIHSVGAILRWGASVGVLGAILGLSSFSVSAAQTVDFSAGTSNYKFDQATGHLIALVDVSTDAILCEPQGDNAAIWELNLENAGQPIGPAKAGKFAARRGKDRKELVLTWSDFGAALPGLRVEVQLKPSGTRDLSHWRIQVTGVDSNRLRSVTFPRLGNVRKQPNEVAAVPMWMGQTSSKVRELLGNKGRKGKLQWDYPGILSLQCLAVYGDNDLGLYVASDDAAAFRKSFLLTGSTEELNVEIVHLPEYPTSRAAQDGEGIGDWRMPYQVVVGPLHGDWITAAEMYRSWATNQAWAKQSRVQRGLVPDWILNTGIWVWNRGSSPKVLDPALKLQEGLHLPVSVFWHWWHGCSYDDGFPEYFPPREGAEPFISAVDRAQKKDVRALVYMNQRLWGMTTASWKEEGAATYAVKAADGKIRPEIYNTFTRAECAAMCMGTEFWRNKYAGLAEKAIRELGVDGIYMDQACTSLACYDPNHPHPLGGGRYWMQGFQKMQQDIRKRVSGTPARIALAGEGCGEPWLPYLDVMLSLQVSKERYAGLDGWETIPFFHSVYHAHSILYGNYSSLTMPPYDELWPAATAPAEPLKLLDRKFSGQFYLEQARAFVWGQQPTIANFLPELMESRKEEIQFVLRLARLRSHALTYLQEGTFVRPPSMNTPMVRLPMSRLSIYAGQQGGLREFEMDAPLALTGAWRSPKGNVAVALASISDAPMQLALNLEGADWKPAPGARIWRIDEGGRKPAGSLEGNKLMVDLEARGACVLEFRRN